ncbi:MAG: DUF2283 domain-containing protein [Dehalococcoidia bacterium]
MKTSMTLKYDPASDTLYIDACPPYEEQESDEIAQGVAARLNPSSGDVENLEVMFFRQRFAAGKPFEIPVSVDMRSARQA